MLVAIVGCLLCDGFVPLNFECESCANEIEHGHLCTLCARGITAMILLIENSEKAAE